MSQETKLIKTYMSFGLPLDPSNIKTLADLDLAYALASTLVDWNDTRNLKEGLVVNIPSPVDNEVLLSLKPSAKWSNGEMITAEQVARSFSYIKKMHAEELKSLFEVIDSIEAKDNRTVRIKLNRSVSSSGILHKLTEPMYGILYVGKDDKLDLSITSGPYFLQSESVDELILKVNTHWYSYESGMANLVTIRRPKKDLSGEVQDSFSSDPWPNVLSSSSLVSDEVAKQYRKDQYSIWNRNLDRVFFMSPSSKLFNESGRQLIKALSQKLDRSKITDGLSGYHLNDQFFPPGYVIFDKKFKKLHTDVSIPVAYQKKAIVFLSALGRLSITLTQNLSHAVKAVTGIDPIFRTVPLADFEKERAAGNYDILLATLAVNDPNVEGAVSFFFGMVPALIPDSSGSGNDFKSRIAKARTLPELERDEEYREVFTKSVQEGCVLPLFHFSSVVIARNGIDLSIVPTSDETVAFSKVRFR